MILDELKTNELSIPPGIESRFRMDQIESYYGFLKTNRKRFFSRTDQERILVRHLYESLIIADYVASAVNVSRETTVADAGSGPGLPGYLFACRQDQPELNLIDSSARNLGMLEVFHSKLSGQTGKVRFHYARLEELRGAFELIVCRALFPFPFVVELICQLQSPGDVFAISAANLATDNPRVIDYLDTLGYVSRETITPPELQFLGSRNVYLFRKEKQTKKGYPRIWKRIKEAQQQWEKQSQ